MSNDSVGRVPTNRRTEGQTDRTDFIPSTADAGGNNTYLIHVFRTIHFRETYKKEAMLI